MDLKEKLTFYHKLICSTYSLSLWSYSRDFKLLDTTATWDLISVSDFIPAVSSHLASGSFSPLILETNVGMLWIIGFAHAAGTLESIHFLGPAVIGKDTSDLLRQKLETYELSVHIHATVNRMIAKIPEIPNSMLVNYAVMLHYTLNDENIPLSEVSFYSEERKLPSPDSSTSNSITPENLWKKEQLLCQMFQDGDSSAATAIISMLSVTSGINNTGLKDTVRKNKNNALILLTLCSRSCIQGGMHPSVAYDLSESYCARLEECRTTGEVVKFCKNMVSGFMARMQQAKAESSITPPIQSVCRYLHRHMEQPLCMEDLARLTGYTEYYLSYKFQKETGLTIKEFLLNERISQAKILLCDSAQSIQDVSDALGFSNRSYFSTCFRKKVGMSPSQYQAQNAKI